jgi:hypothetical protein
MKENSLKKYSIFNLNYNEFRMYYQFIVSKIKYNRTENK